MTGSWEILPHPSDIGFRARGEDDAEALAALVTALAAVMLGATPPAPVEDREVSLPPDDLPFLATALLEECLYLVDAEDWLAVGAEVEVGPEGLHGRLLGLPADPDLLAEGVHVKAITWHELRAARGPGGTVIQVFVDL